MMLPDIFNVINRARFSGIGYASTTVPTLYQRCVQVFVCEMSRKCKIRDRMTELNYLPTVAVVSIMEEMSYNYSMRKWLYQELTDPALFMRMFSHSATDRRVLEKCLRSASKVGRPVLPIMAKRYCKMVEVQKLDENSERFINRIVDTMKLGSYLHDAGWYHQSLAIYTLALRWISVVKDMKVHKKLVLDCTQKMLRSEGSALLKAKSYATCQSLISLIEDETDNDTLLKIYLEVANHHFKSRRVSESHLWNSKAWDLISESTASGLIIEALQLEALYCFQTKRFENGNLMASQAIQRARKTFGHVHRRYADTLYTYGVCLLRMHAISDAISVLLELLDILSKLYGEYTPHVAIIQSYLAYGFYHRSQSTGRFDMAYDHIEKAISLARQIMPERKKVIEHFGEVRNMIMKGRNEQMVVVDSIRAPRLSDFPELTVQEIKDFCKQLNDA